jgi:hypothetical protein
MTVVDLEIRRSLPTRNRYRGTLLESSRTPNPHECLGKAGKLTFNFA